jgi:hypothetical protein
VVNADRAEDGFGPSVHFTHTCEQCGGHQAMPQTNEYGQSDGLLCVNCRHVIGQPLTDLDREEQLLWKTMLEGDAISGTDIHRFRSDLEGNDADVEVEYPSAIERADQEERSRRIRRILDRQDSEYSDLPADNGDMDSIPPATPWDAPPAPVYEFPSPEKFPTSADSSPPASLPEAITAAEPVDPMTTPSGIVPTSSPSLEDRLETVSTSPDPFRPPGSGLPYPGDPYQQVQPYKPMAPDYGGLDAALYAPPAPDYGPLYEPPPCDPMQPPPGDPQFSYSPSEYFNSRPHFELPSFKRPFDFR